MTVYDLSVPLQPGLPTYDDEPGPSLTPLQTLQVDGANVSLLRQSVHAGTHIDAPLHYLAEGAGAEAAPLEVLLGPCLVVEHRSSSDISADDLEAAQVPEQTRRLIFKTTNSELWSEQRFRRDFLALEPSAARWLVARGVQLVGIDYLSVDPYDAPEQTAHRTLLAAGVVVVEGLDLRGVPPGPYQLACLPIRLVGADAAPARVVLIAP